MPSVEEINYSSARDNIDLIIKNSSSNAQKHLRTIVQYRSKIMLNLMQEWIEEYKDKITYFSELIDTSQLQENLGAVYMQYVQYVQYVFMYRFLNGLENNILFHKIISFELHFFSKMKILSPIQYDGFIEPGNMTDDENLFYISPLGHFFYYRILKEYHLTPRSDLTDVVKKQRIYDGLLDIVRTSMTDFFSDYRDGSRVHLDDFRNFLERVNNRNLQAVFTRIESRECEID